MRIFVGLSERMVYAMRRDPCDRSGLETKRTARGEKSLEPDRRFKAAVCEQSMISDPNAPTSCDPPHNEGRGKILPAKREERSYGDHMESGDKEDGVPVGLGRGCEFNYILQK